jgi:hypothetical protein
MPPWFYFNTVVLPLLGMGMGAFFLLGVYRTVNHWIERKHERELIAQGGDSPGLLEAVGTRLDDMGERIQEIEERMDFTERMLTQQRDQNRLGSGE